MGARDAIAMHYFAAGGISRMLQLKHITYAPFVTRVKVGIRKRDSMPTSGGKHERGGDTYRYTTNMRKQAYKLSSDTRLVYVLIILTDLSLLGFAQLHSKSLLETTLIGKRRYTRHVIFLVKDRVGSGSQQRLAQTMLLS